MTRRRLPRNDAAILDAELLLDGEIAFDTTNKNLRLGDGSTLGGQVLGEGVTSLDQLTYERVPGRVKDSLSKLLETATSITELGGVQDYNFTTGAGTSSSTTDLANFADDMKGGNLFIPGGDELGFMISNTIALNGDKAIVGDPRVATHTTSKTSGVSKIAFRPTGADKVAIKAKLNNDPFNERWGQGVSNIAIDGDNVGHNAVQFVQSYSNEAEHLSLWGTWDVGLIADTTYVTVLDHILANGNVVFKTAAVAIGDNNAVEIYTLHTGCLPINAADRTYSLLVNGLCHGLTVVNPIIQGTSVGIHISGGTSAVFLVNPYYENVVCPEILGSSGGTGVDGMVVQGGTYAGPYSNHSQYASRFTGIGWHRGTNGVKRVGFRANFQPDPTFRTGTAGTGLWGIVGGASSGNRIEPGSLYDDPAVASKANGGDLLMREQAGSSPSYVIDDNDHLDHGQWQRWQKVDGAYGGQGYLFERDNTGTEVKTAYQPVLIPDAIPALFTPDAPTVASLIK